MALQSELFAGNPELEAAAVSDPAHIFQGARGEHVRKIQSALNQLDDARLVADAIYGPATAKAVSAYKRKRNILNTQNQIDNIVGKKTTASLDSEMQKRERALAQGVPVLILGFGIEEPPVPTATRFAIRTLLVGLKSLPPFRIYQVIDTQNRLTAFYFMGDKISMSNLRAGFLLHRIIDRGNFRLFTTTLPAQVTAFQPEPCFETIRKTQIGPGRERVELQMPFFQKGGISLSMEGLQDNNSAINTLSTSGIMSLVEPKPRVIL